MSKIGIKLQNELSIRENVLLAQYAEARGLDTVWSSEYRRDAVVFLGLLAAGTERVRLGTSIVPIYTRSPVVLAMSAAAVWELAPGRVVLGIGSSTPGIVERWHGGKRERPLVALRENVEAIRAILSGEKVRYAGEVVSVDGFQLENPDLAAPDLPIFTAALGEQAVRLAGRLADGMLLNTAPIAHLGSIRERLDAASVAAGRSPGTVEMVGDVRVGVGVGSAAKHMREDLRSAVASYGGVGVYNRFFAEAGYPDQAAAIAAAWEARDRQKAAAAVDDAMLDAIVAVGDESAVQERIAAFLAAGMDEVIVFPTWHDERPADATRRIIDVVAEVRASA